MSAQIEQLGCSGAILIYLHRQRSGSSPSGNSSMGYMFNVRSVTLFNLSDYVFISKSLDSPYKSPVTSHTQIVKLGMSTPKVQLKRRISLFMVYSARWPPRLRVELTCDTCSLDLRRTLISSPRGSRRFHCSSSPAMKKRKNALLLFYGRWEI